MKFLAFKEFRSFGNAAIDEINRYLAVDLAKIIKELRVGLEKLSIGENFASFSVDVTIGAGVELQIRNQFRDGTIPTQRLVVRGGDGSWAIADGPTRWDTDFVYLKNYGGSTASATVVFLK